NKLSVYRGDHPKAPCLAACFAAVRGPLSEPRDSVKPFFQKTFMKSAFFPNDGNQVIFVRAYVLEGNYRPPPEQRPGETGIRRRKSSSRCTAWPSLMSLR
ncbi:hypothetical protein, partial [Novosphingobium profundi]|uniref:hypothetical protein n=1 Tax=Novosphingobium profundi TaxID=1774954 RepID=UPI001CFEDE31